MRRIIQGVLVSLAALILFMIMVEASLWIIGFFYHKNLAAAKKIGKGDFLVYCFGDSFTYGIGSENKKGYPEQLQELCEKQYPSEHVKVINFGIPGSNSSQVLKYFKYILNSGSYIKPSLVIVMTGINDWWNVAENAEVVSYSRMNPFLAKCSMVAMRSKIAKLFMIYCANKTVVVETSFKSQTVLADPDEFLAQKRLGDKHLNTVRLVFEQNMNEFVDFARACGIDVLFSQYPKGFVFDKTVENISKRKNVAIVYNYARFKENITHGRLDECFSSQYSYSHPNTKGYALIAEEMLAAIIKKNRPLGMFSKIVGHKL
ncbi:MAG: GDSL-type esterase/lipase family protein [Candidatus Omnitrophota bacterium]|jgi:lysophospholipase L1-like esterase